MENPTLPTKAKPPCQPLTVVILSGFSKWKYEVSSLMIFL